MTSFAPSPHGSSGSSTRVRVKWDNVMIVLIGVVVAAFAVVGILLYADTGATPTAAKDPSAATAPETEASESAYADVAPGELSLDQAIEVVAEARTLMSEGRWVEAADRLELIPEDLRDGSGATVALSELEERRSTHDQLRAELEAAVEARNWKGAQAIIAKLSALAPLDADLTATQELIDTALTPKGSTKATGTKPPATTATTSGGGSTATKPAAAPTVKPSSGAKPASSSTRPAASGTTKPSSGGTRPPVIGGGASSGGSSATSGAGATAGSAAAGSSTGTAGTGAGTGATAGTSNVIAGIGAGTTLGDLGINLTPAQEAELEAALEQAMAGL